MNASAPPLHGIYAEIWRRIEANDAVFPALPETAVQLHSVMQHPSCEVRVVARIVQMDAGLSAFLMQCANRLRYFTRVAPQDLQCAIRRIGLNDTYNYAVSYFCRSTFETGNSRVRARLTRSYRNAVRTAALASLLATPARYPRGRAMLAGLLQDIGIPPLLSCIAELAPQLLDDAPALEQALDKLCPLVSTLLLNHWNFDNELLEVARCRKDWMRDSGAPADLADLVTVARLHAAIGTSEIRGCPPLPELPALAKLKLGELTPDNSLAMVVAAQEELEDIRSLLGS